MATCGNCGKTGATVAEIRECYGGPVRYSVPAAPKLVEITEGFWKLNVDVFKVVRAVHGSGNLYAKQLELTTVPAEDGGTKTIGSFVYAPGVISLLRREGAHELSAEEASKFGQLYGFCVFCTKTLTDERSQHVGYGQKCAQNQGLPWGERPETITTTSEGVTQ